LVLGKNIGTNISNDVVPLDVSKIENRPTIGIGMEIFTSFKLNELGFDGINGLAWINH
jgi:Na+/phosphate symporter